MDSTHFPTVFLMKLHMIRDMERDKSRRANVTSSHFAYPYTRRITGKHPYISDSSLTQLTSLTLSLLKLDWGLVWLHRLPPRPLSLGSGRGGSLAWRQPGKRSRKDRRFVSAQHGGSF